MNNGNILKKQSSQNSKWAAVLFGTNRVIGQIKLENTINNGINKYRLASAASTAKNIIQRNLIIRIKNKYSEGVKDSHMLS